MYSYIRNACWLPTPNRVELYFGEAPADLDKVAAVFVYAFDAQGQLLMVSEKEGFWELPGGGREAGESLTQTAQREVLEEANTTIKNVQPFAYQRLHVQGEKPEKYRRPYPEAFEVFMVAEIDRMEPFAKESETIGREMFDIGKAIEQDGIQFENRHVILEKAIEALKGKL